MLFNKYYDFYINSIKGLDRRLNNKKTNAIINEKSLQYSDIVQEGFTIALRQIKRGRFWGEGDFKNWSYGIMKYEWTDYIKKLHKGNNPLTYSYITLENDGY